MASEISSTPPVPSTPFSTSQRPGSFLGIDHLKLPCTNINTTLHFYTHVLPFTRVIEWDHYTPQHKLFAYMLRWADLLLELRHVPDHAARQRGWDPVTWSVETRADLEDWGKWFDGNGVKRSRVLTGLKGWVIGAEDPDGRIVRMYCKEEHEWTDHPDQDEYWLGTVTGQD